MGAEVGKRWNGTAERDLGAAGPSPSTLQVLQRRFRRLRTSRPCSKYRPLSLLLVSYLAVKFNF